MMRGVLARWSGRLAAFLRRIARALERLSDAPRTGFADLAAQFPGAPEHWLRDVAALADNPAEIRRVKVAEPAPRAPRREPATDVSLRAPARYPSQEPPAIAKAPRQRPASRQNPATPKVRFLPPNANPRPPRFMPVDPPGQSDMARAALASPDPERAAPHRQDTPTPKRRAALRLIPPAPERAPAEPRADDAVALARGSRANPPSMPAPRPRAFLAGIRAALKTSLRRDPAVSSATSPQPRHAAMADPVSRHKMSTHAAVTQTVPPALRSEQAASFAPGPRGALPERVPSRPGTTARREDRWAPPIRNLAAAEFSERWPALPPIADADRGIEPPRLHELRREQEQGLWSG